MLNCAETHKNPFCRGTARTENRNRSNRSTPNRNRAEPNRGHPVDFDQEHYGRIACFQVFTWSSTLYYLRVLEPEQGKVSGSSLP